jgi:hypothetical protein
MAILNTPYLCPANLWYYPRSPAPSWPHICPLWATISDHLWIKIAKNCWKYFFSMFASISSNSTHKWVNKRWWANKWYHLWCLLPSRTYIVTPRQSRIAKGIHGLLKVSPGSYLPDPSMPCWRATPEMALQPFMGWLACRAGGLQPSSTPLDTPDSMGLPNSLLQSLICAWAYGKKYPWTS